MKLKQTAICVLLLAATMQGQAKEGPDQYPNGAESLMSGALPPPGDYFLNYLGHYSGTLVNNNGDDVIVPAPGGNVPSQKVTVDADFDAFRFVHVTPWTLFGASVAFQAIVPVVHQNLDIGPLGGSASRTGLGDISFDPLILGWHWQNLHVTSGLDIYVPSGAYDRHDPRRQIGTNYYTFEPVTAVTYRADSGFEASIKMMYDINERNDDTHYKSGQELHADYFLGWHAGAWSYGAGGYFAHQVEDDKLANLKIDDSRGRVWSIGPDVQYTDSKGHQFILQWQHETGAKNRFEGDKLWLRFVTRF